MSITPPSNLVAVVVSTSQINLTWGPSIPSGAGGTGDIVQGDILSGDILTQGGGVPTVTGYNVFRDGLFFTALGNVLTFSDTGIPPNTLHAYYVVGLDSVGETSAPSNTTEARTLPVLYPWAPVVPGMTLPIDEVRYDGQFAVITFADVELHIPFSSIITVGSIQPFPLMRLLFNPDATATLKRPLYREIWDAGIMPYAAAVNNLLPM